MSTETIRPDSAGDETNLLSSDGANYTLVDDTGEGDGDATYVEKIAATEWLRDLYNLGAHTGSGTINSVTVYCRAKMVVTTDAAHTHLKTAIKSGGSVAEGNEEQLTESYALYSTQHDTPPEGGSWDWDKIDALQAGVNLEGILVIKGTIIASRCTQVYVVVNYTPPPAPPTNVQATDGTHTDKVVITWTKSSGATGYQVYRDGIGLGWLGDVATHNDTGAGAPSITPGSAIASDGAYTDKVALSLSGTSVNNGTTHTYKVKARSGAGESGYSGTHTGYRGHGALTYQWQRSTADNDTDYSNIDGATTASYDDYGAPEDGSGRYYKCVENADGAVQQISTSDRGYRVPPPPSESGMEAQVI